MDEEKRNFGVKLLIVLLMVVKAVFMYLEITGRYSLFPEVSDENKKQAKSNCDNLVVPENFVKVKEYSAGGSEGITYGTEYISTTDPEDVERYFVNLLVPQGWEYEKEGEFKFYRGKFSIGVEYGEVGFTGKWKYWVSCSWDRHPHGLIGDMFREWFSQSRSQ